MRAPFLALAYLLLLAEISAAETFSLTLKQAVALSMEKNNLVTAAGYTADSARQDIDIAKARYFPLIAFEEAFVISNSPTQAFMMKLDESRFAESDLQVKNLNNPATQHDFRTALIMQQALYDPALSPAIKIAEQESERQNLNFNAVKEETAYRIFRQFLDVRKAKARQQAVEQAFIDARENVRLAKVRTGAGLGLKSDEMRARTHLSSIEQQQITAGNSLTLARMQLADLIGLTSGDDVDTVEQHGTIGPYIPTDELVKTALQNRLELKRSRTELEKSDAVLNLARSGYLPSLTAVASYQMNGRDNPFGSDNDSWFAGVTLKWQLFDGFKRNRENDRAIASRSAAAEFLANRIRETGYQVKESCLRRDEMGKRLEVSRNSLADAEETVRLLTKRFENSLATMVELLDAQTVLNQVRATLVETESDYMLATGNVYYSAGIFMREIVK